jgi:hypothetical protein
VIDPVRRADSAQPHLGAGTGPPPTPVHPVHSALPDQIIVDPTIWQDLTSAQSQLIIALVRATLESFATPGPGTPAGGTVETLHAALVALHALEHDLTATRTRHQDQVNALEPVLNALLEGASGDTSAALAPRPAVNATPTPSAALMAGATPIASLAQSLGEAIDRLQKILSATPPIAAPLAEQADPLDAFRWLLHAAQTVMADLSEPGPVPGQLDRFMNLAHALLVAAPRATPGREVPPAGDVLDRFIGVVRLLAPMLNAQLMAELEAAGMPPFIQPADSPANLEAFRWLLVAVQAYHSARVGPRPARHRCDRCGRLLQRQPMGQLNCPTCAG